MSIAAAPEVDVLPAKTDESSLFASFGLTTSAFGTSLLNCFEVLVFLPVSGVSAVFIGSLVDLVACFTVGTNTAA